MRPSALPGLLQAARRNAARGLSDVALFEVGPVFADDTPAGQRTAVAAVRAPHAPRRWDGGPEDDVYTLKGDLMALLASLGAPTASLQVAQGSASPWWRPGRSARVQLGPKAVIAEFGALHPRVLKALDLEGPVYGFELSIEALPEPKRAATRARPALSLAALMPVKRDFAFVLARDRSASELVRAAQAVDRALISGVHVFDVYEGAGVSEGLKSVAIEVTLQPSDRTLADADIEALSERLVSAVLKATGATLRS